MKITKKNQMKNPPKKIQKKTLKSFLMASQMKNAPTTIIMRLPHVAFAIPVYVRNSLKLLTMKSVTLILL